MVSSPVLATLCYVISDSKVLMLHRNKRLDDFHFGKYVGLGGKIELNETPHACVVRELREEAGISIDPHFRGIMYFIDERTSPPKNKHWIVFIYTSMYSQEPVMKENHEGTLEWIAIKDLASIPMWKGDYAFLDRLLKTNEIIELFHHYIDDSLVEE